MKRTLLALALLTPLAAAAAAHADDGPPDCVARKPDGCVEVGPYAVPRTPEEAVVLRDLIAREPAGGAVVATLALMAWHADAKVGEPLLVLAVSERHVGKGRGPGSHKGYVLSTALRNLTKMFERSRHCARSYAVGATPANRYAFDPNAVTLRIYDPAARAPVDPAAPPPTTRKVFVCSSGADTCRPITVTMNRNGIWKADEMSSLFVGCRAMPAEPTAGGAEDEL